MYNPLYEPTRKLDLITDGGSGIGRVFAQEMATLHHIVIVGGVNADSARQVCEEKKRAGICRQLLQLQGQVKIGCYPKRDDVHCSVIFPRSAAPPLPN